MPIAFGTRVNKSEKHVCEVAVHQRTGREE